MMRSIGAHGTTSNDHIYKGWMKWEDSNYGLKERSSDLTCEEDTTELQTGIHGWVVRKEVLYSEELQE